MDFDFIIIGGGICGLEIGSLVSKLGRTLLLEAKEKLGGRALVSIKNEFKLDFGPHPIRFGPNSALAATIRDIGGKIQFINPGMMYAYLSNGERHIFPSGGLKAILKTKMVPKLKTLKFLLSMRKINAESLKSLYPVSLYDYCEKEHVIPELKRFLLMASASMQVNPFAERTSIGEMFENFIQVLKRKSVFYPIGGWGEIIEQLKNPIEKNGEIHSNAAVSKIVIENNIVIGVEVDGELIRGKIVISTLPVQNLFDILDETLFPSIFVNQCKNLRPTAGIVIDFCLSQPISKESLVFFENPPSFGLFPTNMDPNLAPQGKAIMSFFAPTNIDIIKDEEQRQTFYNDFKQKIFQIYPDIPKYLEFERPLFLEMVDGVEIAIDQNRLTRPMSNECGIKNLYFTGDSIGGEGAGGDVGHTSVRECYKLIKKNWLVPFIKKI